MAATSSITIRRARRDDVGAMVRMLADDPLGSARERIEDPLPPSYFRAFEAVEHASHIQLMVAEDGDGTVVGCLQLCVLPGISSQGASRGLIEDVRVASHCRSLGIGGQMIQWAIVNRAPRGASSSSCSRTTPASMPSGSMRDSDFSRAMSG
jgi:N-acetylglutamate synthase-like GNAT family acetyltransferase